jgi:hypothetical protein
MSHRNRALYSPNALTIFSDPLFQEWSASFEAELFNQIKRRDIVVASFPKAASYLYGAALENVIDTMDEGDEWWQDGIYSLLYGNRDSVMADITMILPSGTWYDRRDREVETLEVDKWMCLYCGGHAPCTKPECVESLEAAKERMGGEAEDIGWDDALKDCSDLYEVRDMNG